MTPASPQRDHAQGGAYPTPEQLQIRDGREAYTETRQERLFGPSGPDVMRRQAPSLYRDTQSERLYSIVGTAFDTYVMVEREGTLHFIDFHAAHERFIYDELMKRGRERDRQELMFPVMVELSLDDFHCVMDNLEIFSEIGFDMEEFSDRTITIRAVPSVIPKLEVEDFVREAAGELREGREKTGLYEALAASTACHGAKRSGDSLTARDMELIVERVFEGKHELRCPHGRPFVHTVTKDDLERIFKRQ